MVTERELFLVGFALCLIGELLDRNAVVDYGWVCMFASIFALLEVA